MINLEDFQSDIRNTIERYKDEVNSDKIRSRLADELASKLKQIEDLLPSDLKMGVKVTGEDRWIHVEIIDENQKYTQDEIRHIINDALENQEIKSIRIIAEIDELQ